MSTPLRVLLVEDLEDDDALIERELRRVGFEPTIERVETGEAMRRALDSGKTEVILCDDKLPQFNATAALSLLQDSCLDLPFIIVSGAIGEERAVELMRAGAHDYVMKDNLKRLPAVVRREVYHAAQRHAYKEADEALQESEARYKALFTGVAQGIAVADVKTRQQLYANPAMCRMFGYTEEEFKRLKVEDIHPKESWGDVKLEFEAQVRSEKPLASDLPCLRKDGTIFYADISTAAIVLDGRKCIVGFFTDITERKKMEETQKRLVAIIEATPDLVGFADVKDKRALYLNKAGRKMCGVGYDEDITKMKISDFHPEWANKMLAEEILPAVIRDGVWTGEFTFLNIRDKHEIPVLMVLTSQKAISGEVEVFATISRDITERKQMEERLLTSEAVYKALIETTGTGYVIIDTEGNVLDANLEYVRLTGHRKLDEIRGRSVIEWTADYEKKKNAEAVAKCAKDGYIRNLELDYIDRHGKITPIDVNATAVEIDGTPQILALCRDITERKRAEAALEQQSQELAASNAELRQFAYVASHDLQEPLRMVTSYVQLLVQRYRGKMGADADEFIGYAAEGAMRMQALINDLLEYSRIGTRGKAFEPTNSRVIFDQAVANLQVSIAEHHAVVTCGTLPTVMADGVQLTELFQNLIGNAVKFHGKEPPRVHAEAKQKNNEWVFSVRDNGVGIDPQFFDRVFVIFQRLHARSEYPGSGIGLAICKKIVERHEGRIWVESELGKGSTFYFTIPVSAEKP